MKPPDAYAPTPTATRGKAEYRRQAQSNNIGLLVKYARRRRKVTHWVTVTNWSQNPRHVSEILAVVLAWLQGLEVRR